MQELKLLDEESNVYKLIGPALVKQDPLEAKHNVEKRLEYIGHELGRLDGQAKGLDEKRVQKQQSVSVHSQWDFYSHDPHICIAHRPWVT